MQHDQRGLGLDFVSASLSNGRRIECLAVTDDFSQECIVLAVDHGIGGEYVIVLDDLHTEAFGESAPVIRTTARLAAIGVEGRELASRDEFLLFWQIYPYRTAQQPG